MCFPLSKVYFADRVGYNRKKERRPAGCGREALREDRNDYRKTEKLFKEMDDYLRAHELLKVKLQDGCVLDSKEAANAAAEELGAEFVQAIGKKFSLYRRSDKNLIELPKK